MAETDIQRTRAVVADVFQSVRDVIRRHELTYEEYQAGRQWLIDVGEVGEWPLLLDVFIERTVEQQVFKDREGSDGTILGPYYLPDAPMLEPPYALPMRPDEKGDPLVLTGRVVSTDGKPIEGAVVDFWQCDADGYYSGFSDIPEGILRGKVATNADGEYQVQTIRPAPYTIPHDGPTGRMIAACGWHPWRPAHVHMIVSADGHEPLTTQLFLDDSDYLEEDVAGAVKDELVVDPEWRDPDPDVGMDRRHLRIEYEFVLPGIRDATGVA